MITVLNNNYKDHDKMFRMLFWQVSKCSKYWRSEYFFYFWMSQVTRICQKKDKQNNLINQVSFLTMMMSMILDHNTQRTELFIILLILIVRSCVSRSEVFYLIAALKKLVIVTRKKPATYLFFSKAFSHSIAGYTFV